MDISSCAAAPRRAVPAPLINTANGPDFQLRWGVLPTRWTVYSLGRVMLLQLLTSWLYLSPSTVLRLSVCLLVNLISVCQHFPSAVVAVGVASLLENVFICSLTYLATSYYNKVLEIQYKKSKTVIVVQTPF